MGDVSAKAATGFELEYREPGNAAETYARLAGRAVGLTWFKGDFWRRYGGQWKVVPHEEVRDDLMGRLKDATYTESRGKEGYVKRRVSPNVQFVEDTLSFLKAEVKAPWKTSPAWVTGREGDPDPMWCVAFEDVVVDVKGGKVLPREDRWFGTVVPVSWEEAKEAKRERWEQAVKEWGNGDPEWGRLLQRIMGYMLVADRRWRKWVLIQGVTGGGKGVIQHVCRALLGSRLSNRSLGTIASEFGLAGLQHSQVLWVPEVSREGSVVGRRAGRHVKEIVGQDLMTINNKYGGMLFDVSIPALVVMTSNVVPELDDEMGGLTNKMLTLPIMRSFDKGGADFGLKDRLVQGELPGIAAWAMEGLMELVRLEKEGRQGEMWPQVERGRALLQEFKAGNSPVAEFMQEVGEEDETGFVASSVLFELWEPWAKKRGWWGRKEVPMSQQALSKALEKHGAWPLVEFRQPGGGRRGWKGIKLKREDRR